MTDQILSDLCRGIVWGVLIAVCLYKPFRPFVVLAVLIVLVALKEGWL